MIPVIANGLATAARIFPLAARLLAPYKGSSGLVNLAMDAIPIAVDASNDNLGWHSLSSIAGTQVGSAFGRRVLNQKGAQELEKIKQNAFFDAGAREVVESARARRKVFGGTAPFIDFSDVEKELLKHPQYSEKGFNMPLGLASDIGLSAVSYPMSQKAKEYDALQKRGRMAELNNDALAQYMRMT